MQAEGYLKKPLKIFRRGDLVLDQSNFSFDMLRSSFDAIAFESTHRSNFVKRMIHHFIYYAS